MKFGKKPLIVICVSQTVILAAVLSGVGGVLGVIISFDAVPRWAVPVVSCFARLYLPSQFPEIFVFACGFFQLVVSVRQILTGINLFKNNLTDYRIARKTILWGWGLTVINPVLSNPLAFILSGVHALTVFWLNHPRIVAGVETGFIKKEIHREGRQRGLSELETATSTPLSSSAVIIIAVLQILIAVDLLRVSLWLMPFAGKYLYIQTRFEFFVVLCVSKIGAILSAVLFLSAGNLTLRFHILGRFLMHLLGWVAVAAAGVNVLLINYSRFDEWMRFLYIAAGIFFVVFSYSVIVVLRNWDVRRQFTGDLPEVLAQKKTGKWVLAAVCMIFVLVFGVSLKSGERKGVELFKNIIYLVKRHNRDKILERWQEVQAQFYDTLKEKKFVEAEKIGLDALRLAESLWGPDHPQVAAIANDLAVAYFSLEQYEPARELFARALDIHEYLLGQDDPVVAADLNNMASVYRIQENFDRAEKMLERALAIYTNIFGADHYHTRMTRINLQKNQAEKRSPRSRRPPGDVPGGPPSNSQK